MTSILVQTFRDFEFIVVDDGSTDQTPEVLGRLASRDKRLRVIVQPNAGIVMALNRAIDEASGTWIARMDSDDVSLPDRLKRQYGEAIADPDVAVLGGDCILIDEGGRRFGMKRFPSKRGGVLRSLEGGGVGIAHPTAFIRKKYLDAAGGYRERFRHAEDTDLWLRLAEMGDIRSIGAVVLLLRKHDSNVSLLSGGASQRRSSHAARGVPFPTGDGPTRSFTQRVLRMAQVRNWLEGRLVRIEEQDIWLSRARLVASGGARHRATELLNPVAVTALCRYVRLKLRIDENRTSGSLLRLTPTLRRGQ